MSEELKTKTATEGDAVTDITIPADLQEKLAEYGADNDTMKKIVCDLGVEGLTRFGRRRDRRDVAEAAPVMLVWDRDRARPPHDLRPPMSRVEDAARSFLAQGNGSPPLRRGPFPARGNTGI